MALWKRDGEKVIKRLLDAPDDIDEMKSWLATCQQKANDSALRLASGMVWDAINAASGQQHTSLTEAEQGQQPRERQQQQQQQQQLQQQRRQSQCHHSSVPAEQQDEQRRQPMPATTASTPTAPPATQKHQVELPLTSRLWFYLGWPLKLPVDSSMHLQVPESWVGSCKGL